MTSEIGIFRRSPDEDRRTLCLLGEGEKGIRLHVLRAADAQGGVIVPFDRHPPNFFAVRDRGFVRKGLGREQRESHEAI
jgi:hypothetical protein